MKLRPRDRIALGIVLAVVVVGAFYMLALRPEQQKASDIDAQIATQRQTLAQEQQTYEAGRAAEATLKARSAQWAALSLAVPAQSNIPALLRLLERNAKAVNVKMQSIQLTGASSSSTSTPSAAGSSTSSGSSSASATPAATSTAATGVPVQLTFAGGYRALDALVHRLDSLVVLSGTAVHASGPLMSISKVALSGAPNLTVQLSATIYQLSAATAPGTTTGGQP
jgi:hypothetical protein